MCVQGTGCGTLELARHISQPSEPLAERWTRGWQELLEEIGSIEERLLPLRSSP